MTLLTSLLLSGCEPRDPLDGLILVTADPPDAALDGLSDEEIARFDEGDAKFEAVFRESQGLGPAYIRTSCAACHASDARGPGMVTKMAVLAEDGWSASPDQSALPWGGTVRPFVAGGALTPLVPPEGVPSLLVTSRFGPAVYGRGYLEAVADEEIEAAEALQEDEGRVSGRISWLTDGSIGRFGVKARVATLDGFAADALLGDMSITSPLFPDEKPNPDGLVDDLLPGVDTDQETVDRLGDYMRMLAIPARDLPDEGGDDLFVEAGCADCHVPALRTRSDYPVTGLAGIQAEIYTDLLLHDMGEGASDGQIEGGASEREFRTAPLLGLRHLRNYLHDGRAQDIPSAVAAHASPGSEANPAVAAFDALSDEDQEILLRFVGAL